MLQVQLYAVHTAVVLVGKPLTTEASLGLVEVAEAQVAQEPQAQIPKPPPLMLAGMVVTQPWRVQRGLVELMVIQWEAEAAKAEEPVTLAQVTAMVGAPNTAEAEAAVAEEPLILITPMTKNRVVLVFLARVAAVAAGLEMQARVKI